MAEEDLRRGTAGTPPPAHARRPRDPLGRPLPRGVPTQLPMEDFDRLPIQENHRLGLAHFNAGRFFPAHEAWESCWKASVDPEGRALYKGLAQIAAGYVHLRRGNPHGAATLLRRGAGTLQLDRAPGTLDVAAFARMVLLDAERLETTGTIDEAPVLRP